MTDEVFGLGIDEPEMWEAVAALQVMQAIGGHSISAHKLPEPLPLLFHMAGMRLTGEEPTQIIKFDAARRTLAKCPHDAPFPMWLGTESGFKLTSSQIKPVQLPRCHAEWGTSEDIILCPHPVSTILTITQPVWRAIALFLRSFNARVRFMGDIGQRIEGLNFTEGNILSDLPLAEKISILAQAKLVVGMPNAWTWLAATFNRSVLVYYPDTEPMLRWFGFYNTPKHGRVSYSPSHVQIPVMLMGLRTMTNRLNADSFGLT